MAFKCAGAAIDILFIHLKWVHVCVHFNSCNSNRNDYAINWITSGLCEICVCIVRTRVCIDVWLGEFLFAAFEKQTFTLASTALNTLSTFWLWQSGKHFSLCTTLCRYMHILIMLDAKRKVLIITLFIVCFVIGCKQRPVGLHIHSYPVCLHS